MPNEPSTNLVCACPSCATRLRVDEDHLAVANGQVRCGACLAVFDGRANLVAPQRPPMPTEESPAPFADTEATQSPPEPLVEDASPPPATQRTPAAATDDDEAPAQIQAEPEAPPAPGLDPQQMDTRAPAHPTASQRPPQRVYPGIGRALGTQAAVTALALLLVVNVLGLQFDSWSHLPAMRGFYAQACAVAGCDLPPLRRLADITLDNLAAGSRLGPPKPLTLTAALVNRARFPQRFPTLAVRLFDANGEMLAQHRIPPATYLAEGTSPSMAPNRRTPIALRIDDPGTEAISYAITMQ